jgi:hypothetical protein
MSGSLVRRLLAVRRLCVVVALIAASAAPAATAQAGMHTIATVYEAFSYHGVVVPHVSNVESGYCWESSNVTRRLDAWRCFVGNSILDPCFSSEFASNVVCPMPWSDTAVEINLTKPLPRPSNHSAPSLRLQPWAVKTASGAICVLASGASSVVHGKRLNYFCGARLGLWGYPNRKKEPWTILSAPPTARALSRHAAILHAWM